MTTHTEHKGEAQMDENSELAKALLANSLINEDGTVRAPLCCGEQMADDGGCSEGCCDDYKCAKCGKCIRVEWPD